MTTALLDHRRRSLQGWLKQEWPLLLVVVGLIVIRFLWLDADSNVFKRPGDIIDEGAWWTTARSRVLFGEWIIPEDANTLSLWAAPLYALAEAFVFWLAGPSLYTGRLVAALSSVLLLAWLYLALRRDSGRSTALAGVVLLGLNVHFFNYGRVGLIETFRTLLIAGSLWAWLAFPRKPQSSAFLAGLLMASAMLAKVRLDFLFDLAALWLVDWLRGVWQWRRVATAAAVIGGVGVAQILFIVGNLEQFITSIRFELLNTPVTHWSVPAYIPFVPYDVLTNPLMQTLPVYLLFVLAWPALVSDFGEVLASPRAFFSRLKPIDALCVVVFVGALVGGLAYDYGDRRMFPLLIPLACYAARGLLSGGRVAGLASPLAWPRRSVAFVVVGLGYLWLSWWKDAATNPWPDGSLRWWLNWAAGVAVLGSGAAALYVLYRTRWRRDARPLLLAATLSYLFVLTERCAARFGLDILTQPLPGWLPVALAAGLTGFVAAQYVRPPGALPRFAWVWGGAVVYLLFSAGVIGPQLLRPTFSNRDASRAIGQVAGRGEVVLSVGFYEICVENEAICSRWTPDASARGRIFNRDQTDFTVRKFWWTSADEERPYYDPAASSCLVDSTGVVVGSLRYIRSFVIGRGADDYYMNLYEISDPRLTGCAPAGGG